MNNNAIKHSTHLNRFSLQHVQHHGQGPMTLIHEHLASALILWRREVTGDPLSKNIQRHLECMLGIQHVIVPAIHSISLCHHDVQPHIVNTAEGMEVEGWIRMMDWVTKKCSICYFMMSERCSA